MRKILFFFVCFFVQKNIVSGQQITLDTRNISYLFFTDSSAETMRLFNTILLAFQTLPYDSITGSNVKRIEIKEVRIIPVFKGREFLYNQSYIFGIKGDTAFFREEYITGSFPRFKNADKKILKNLISEFIDRIILEATIIKEISPPPGKEN